MKILELRMEDDLMADLEALCSEQRMDVAAAAGEAVRRFVTLERTRGALGSSDLIAAYAGLSPDAEEELEDADSYMNFY